MRFLLFVGTARKLGQGKDESEKKKKEKTFLPARPVLRASAGADFGAFKILFEGNAEHPSLHKKKEKNSKLNGILE